MPQNCCVVGCNNYVSNTAGQNIQYYTFPNKKKWPGRCEKWIAAVRRIRPDGKPWQPSQHSRICSAHFLGGKKSDHPNHAAFVPTLMPDVYGKRKRKECSLSRFQRLQCRSAKVSSILPEVNVAKNKSIEIQTDFEYYNEMYGDNFSVLNCCLFSGDAACQTNISLKPVSNENPLVNLPIKKQLKNSSCGSDYPNYYFAGYESIKDDSQMKSLCNVSLIIFAFLLSYLAIRKYKVSPHNALVIFLMKMKTGLSFSALAVIFGISRFTVQNTFTEVLEQLIDKCSKFVFWPSKDQVKVTLPDCFKNYPNVRCIIDCTEFECEKPPRVDEQVFLYSSYKGYFTLKYLLGITPSGFISFMSKGYGGKSSDAYITVDCGLLDLLEKNDEIMADKGFPHIRKDLEEKSITLVMPPFATSPQFSKEETIETYEIASVRIHVERCIASIRRFNILSKFSHELYPYADAIVRMCAVLVNLETPILHAPKQ